MTEDDTLVIGKGELRYGIDAEGKVTYVRKTVYPPQAVIDAHSMVAQTYAGYLVGHPVRAARYTTPLPGSVSIDTTRPWLEPNPVQDDCIFCVRLDDDEAVRRVLGFQAAIDKEVLSRKWTYLSTWLGTATEDDIHAAGGRVLWKDESVPIYSHDGGSETSALIRARDLKAMAEDFSNRRAFIERFQHEPRQTRSGAPRPAGWHTKAAPIVSLPLRIKRKMCIDWNHVYTDWMKESGTEYDFETKNFFTNADQLTLPAELKAYNWDDDPHHFGGWD